ncbi:ATP-binding protein [uncultured Xylophilus sp.]|uniref:ATP-binding protein n=1 Tax=uncultured Xylophilus sp. TaxID=296832 RepID=UPI0025F9D727|nr:ATP-binding protein [uncultured Xylophilus sp.]
MTASARPSRPHSLRARLLGLVLACILVGSAVLAGTAYRGALHEADAMNDLHLQQVAQSLRANVPFGALGGLGGGADLDLLVQIWGPDGAELYRSARVPLPQRAVLGFSDVTQDGVRYRVYSIQTPLQTVQIAQDLDARQRRARAQALRATLPALLTGPLLMLAVAWVIARTLAPVERMRRQVAARAADDWEPLPDDRLPDEVRPLVQELNLLFGRTRQAFAAQRQFVADAAHELRSPLTALKLQAQALGRAPDDAARAVAVGRLSQGIDRAIALVGQLLDLARQDAGGGAAAATAPPAGVPLDALVRQAVADAVPLAKARGIDIGVPQLDTSRVTAHADALAMLLRNLLDNAVKFTPTGGRIDVCLADAPGGARLTVDDSGPGIPEEERARVFDRFYRSPDAAAGGSGLGLAIVEAVARRHGAALRLDRAPQLGGLRVEVRFPPVATPA